MLQAIIVDDEFKSRTALHRLIGDCCDEVAVVDTVGSVDSAVQAIINHAQLDVVFMNLEMNNQTNLHLLNQFSNLPFDVIFTSARAEYALKAIKFSPIDYLLKPLDSRELQAAINKVKEKKKKEAFNRQMEALMNCMKQAPQKDRQQIAIATQEGLLFLNVADILRCQADGAYTCFS